MATILLSAAGMAAAFLAMNEDAINRIVYDAVSLRGGSISAEHGVGLTKKPYLHHTRSQEEIRLMKAIKAQFDPAGILNPGKIFD